MTSLITDFQLLESLHLRDFEAIDRPAADLGETGAGFGRTGFPASPRRRPDKPRNPLAALASRVGLW